MVEIFETRDEWVAQFAAGWLAHYQQTGETNWKLYQRPRNRTQPSGPGIDLAGSRLGFITTSGAYLPASQAAYDAENALGDYTIRLIPTSTPLDALAFAHTHYNHDAVNADPQVLVPLRHLEALAAEGVVGSLADQVIAYMGYQPDAARTVDELIPAVVRAARDQQLDAAMLVPS